MPRTLRVVIAVLFLASSAFAKIWTVNNNAGVKADFISLADAIFAQSVLSGDTIYVVGSPISYGAVVFNVTKTLHILGPGYFLLENPETQANQNTAQVDGISFGVGSEGSVITGLEFTGLVRCETDNITFKRNLFSTADSRGQLSIFLAHTNIVIIQNYFSGVPTFSSSVIAIGDGSSNILVRNNFIENQDPANFAIVSPPNAGIDVSNNVIQGKVEINNAIFVNNVLRDGSFSGQNNDVRYNIGNAMQFGAANGNQQNVNMADVFINSGSTDGRWRLKDGSPAKGAGLDDVDIGMFGGASPYILSGIPSIPAIYFLNSPAEGSHSGGLPVHIKVKANN